ncbi:AMP-binding protein [Corynebacterium suicordis]
MSSASPQPRPSAVKIASNSASMAGNLAKGLVPLFRSGVLGVINPLALPKVGQGIAQWRFLPTGLLAIAAARDPKHTAIIDDAGEMTYAELNDQVNTLAAALFRAGVRERMKLGVLCRNHRGFIMALCAHGRLGTDIVLLNTGASAEQTRAVINEQQLDMLFIDEEFIPLLPRDFNQCPVIVAWEFGDTQGTTPEQEANAKWASNIQDALDDDDHAQRSEDWDSLRDILRTTPTKQTFPRFPRQGRTIILTSGTTGTPKGAKRPEPKTYLPASSIMSRIPLRHHTGMFIVAPMFHTWGFAQIQLAMALRNTMIMQRKFVPEATVEAIKKHQPYAIAIVPTMLNRVLDETPEGFRSDVKVIATSGEALPPKVLERTFNKFGDVLYNLYGSTEVSWASIAQPAEMRKHPRTAGKPPLATTLKIIGDDGKVLPEDEIGRIFVKNDMLFEGYTRPGTDKDIVDDMVATGDLGYYKDGLLFIAGRSDDMIVSGGENVYPQETEDVINTFEEVSESAVRGVEDDKFGQVLCAWVVLKDKTADDLSDSEKDEFIQRATAASKKKLARHNVPRHFIFLDKLPRNAVGKVVPRELPQPGE